MKKEIITTAGIIVAGLFSQNGFSQTKEQKALLDKYDINVMPLSDHWIGSVDSLENGVKIVMYASRPTQVVTVEARDHNKNRKITSDEVDFYLSELYSPFKDSSDSSGRVLMHKVLNRIKRCADNSTVVDVEFHSGVLEEVDGRFEIKDPLRRRQEDVSDLEKALLRTGLSFKPN